MRGLRILGAVAVLGSALVISMAAPASACSYAHRTAARSSPDDWNDWRRDFNIYTGTVSAVGDNWLEVRSDYVAMGTSPSRILEPNGSMCGPFWRAHDFDVGWPVLVSGDTFASIWNLDVEQVPSLEAASVKLRANNGELAPTNGSGPPTAVVGGWYGSANATVFDGQGQPLHYAFGHVTAQALAPCPSSQLVVIAGSTSEKVPGGQRYQLEVLNTATGDVTEVEVPDLGKFNDEDESYPWTVACADAQAASVVIAIPSDARFKRDVQPIPGRHGDRAVVVDGGTVARWDAVHERMVIVHGGDRPYISFATAGQPVGSDRIELGIDGRHVEDVSIDPRGEVAAVTSSSQANAGSVDPDPQLHWVDLASSAGVVRTDHVAPHQGWSVWINPANEADLPLSTADESRRRTFRSPMAGATTGSAGTLRAPSTKWASPQVSASAAAGALSLDVDRSKPPPMGRFYQEYDVYWHPRSGDASTQVIPGVVALAVASVSDPALPAVTPDRFWPDPPEAPGPRVPAMREGPGVETANWLTRPIVGVALAFAATGAIVVVVMRQRRQRRKNGTTEHA